MGSLIVILEKMIWESFFEGKNEENELIEV